MQLSPKQYAIIILVLAILAGIGAYFARTYKLQTISESKIIEETNQKLIETQAMLVTKESELKRSRDRKTTSTPILLAGKLAYIKTTESSQIDEKVEIERSQYISQLENDNNTLNDKLLILKKLESSKPSVKKWQAIALYNFPGWQAGPGFKMDFSILELGIYGIVNVPELSSYSAAVTIGF
jgi:hypothetical protein